MQWKEIVRNLIEALKYGFDSVEMMVSQRVKKAEMAVAERFYSVKRLVFRSMMELVIITLAVITILIGSILFLDRFLPLDLVLLVLGLVLLNFVLLTGRFKAGKRKKNE